MPRKARRSPRARQPRVIQIAWGVTLLWLAMAALFFVGSGFNGRGTPVFFLAGFVIVPLAWWWAIRTIRAQNAAGKNLEELQALSPGVFEEWVAARFRDLGYSVTVTGTQGDHGVDLIATKPGESAVVQCKKYRASSVGEPVLRDLFGAMHDFGADRAYLVTTGRLTQAAVQWADGKPIELWDGDHLAHLSIKLADGRCQSSAPGSGRSKLAGSLPHADPSTLSPAATALTCPRCGSTLVEKHGRRTGRSFLACPRYPECRHTQPLPAQGGCR